ncbi:MAG: SDR family oxidoreductase [Terracidiphilus sp.]|jgi:thioester reductase-like protein
MNQDQSPPHVAARRTVFLTGGSGLLGTALLHSAGANNVIALYHRSPIAHAGIETLRGDIRKPLLGLSEPDYKALASRIDVIIHSASITRFGVNQAKILDTNVAGSHEIVRLAREARARLIYLSTAFIHPSASELAPASMYEESKRKAEALVRTLSENFVIIRPSIIVGDSRTGKVAAYQGLHEVVGSIIDGSLPVLPTAPDRFCDFVAQDWVTDAIWSAASHSSPAQELWITSGTRALSVEAIVAAAVKVGYSYGFRGSAPRIVPYETLQRLFIPAFLESLPDRLKRRFHANLKMARYMNQERPFPSSEAYLQTAFGLPMRETPEAVLIRNMEQWCMNRLSAQSADKPARLLTIGVS